jgi:hypothetical protein
MTTRHDPERGLRSAPVPGGEQRQVSSLVIRMLRASSAAAEGESKGVKLQMGGEPRAGSRNQGAAVSATFGGATHGIATGRGQVQAAARCGRRPVKIHFYRSALVFLYATGMTRPASHPCMFLLHNFTPLHLIFFSLVATHGHSASIIKMLVVW